MSDSLFEIVPLLEAEVFEKKIFPDFKAMNENNKTTAEQYLKLLQDSMTSHSLQIKDQLDVSYAEAKQKKLVAILLKISIE